MTPLMTGSRRIYIKTPLIAVGERGQPSRLVA